MAIVFETELYKINEFDEEADYFVEITEYGKKLLEMLGEDGEEIKKQIEKETGKSF